MAPLPQCLICHHIVTVITYSETLNCRRGSRLHMPKLRHMIILEKEFQLATWKASLLMGHLHSSISVLWGGCLLQSYDLLLMLLITSWHFGSTKTWGAILNSVQKVEALIEPATPKQKRHQDTLLTPSPKKKPRLFTTLFSSPPLENPFSLAGFSPSLPNSTSPASTSCTEPATEPEADVEDDVEAPPGKPRKTRARVLKKWEAVASESSSVQLLSVVPTFPSLSSILSSTSHPYLHSDCTSLFVLNPTSFTSIPIQHVIFFLFKQFQFLSTCMSFVMTFL